MTLSLTEIPKRISGIAEGEVDSTLFTMIEENKIAAKIDNRSRVISFLEEQEGEGGE